MLVFFRPQFKFVMNKLTKFSRSARSLRRRRFPNVILFFVLVIFVKMWAMLSRSVQLPYRNQVLSVLIFILIHLCGLYYFVHISRH